MERLGDIIEKVRAYAPEADVGLIERAYIYSAKVHQGQLRKSGEPYLMHPLAVASILADLRMDTATIAVGLLHDTIEDTYATEEEVGSLFGEDVLHLVLGVTKIGKMAFTTSVENEAANYRKMILAMADDIRVIIIKLADRLHNLRTLEHLPEAKRKRVARETLEVYAPLAHRLGIAWVKAELEELSFRYSEPEMYEEIARRVAKMKKEREAYIDKIREVVEAKFAESGIKADVLGRAKHFFSIYMKMEKQKIGFDEVYDLLALRVLTDSVRDCYGALGLIHALWKPVPGRFKDYIAMPKENMYQSLHTTVIGPGGDAVEFQIRTREMNRIAEEGIAAHWKYKEGVHGAGGEEQFKWLRHLLEWQQDLKDPRQFLQSFKMDLFPEEVYVFTPKGQVRSFSRGATPVDFAYAIHTDVGHRCVGARVNGRLVPLRYKLKNGDRVEIVTSNSHHPSKDWLKFVVTSRARAKIMAWIKQDMRSRGIDLGKEMLEKELRKHGSNLAKLGKVGNLPDAIAALGYKGLDELLANVGYGKISPSSVARRVLPGEALGKTDDQEGTLGKIVRKITGRDRETGSIKIQGMDDVLIRFSRCCNPVPGDEIVGFITRGRGISVHATDCPNVEQLMLEAERRIEVVWDKGRSAAYPTHLLVECENKTGLLASITSAIAEGGANVSGARIKTHDGRAFNDFEVEITDLDQLNKIIHVIRKLKGIINVVRVKAQPAARRGAH